MTPSALATRVRALRRRLGKRRHEVALDAKVSPATIARIERGAVVPLPATVALLERALRVKPGELEQLVERTASRTLA